MATTKVKGIILSENNMGDYDKMLTILTPNFGKISCAAKGARRPKSALLAGTQLFCFGEYLMYKGTSTYHINSCETIEMFYNIRTDLDKLKYAIHLNKIVQDITEENENCYNILQLYLNALYTISETDKDMDLVVSIFKLRILCILGFTPRIMSCVNCKEKEKLQYFSIKHRNSSVFAAEKAPFEHLLLCGLFYSGRKRSVPHILLEVSTPVRYVPEFLLHS